MRVRLVVAAVAIAATATLTLGSAAPAAAPAGSHNPGRHHVERVPVQPMHSMCGGEVV
ncbi:MAG TPA: hypothetical protein VLK34_01170 [Nocardioidaceae bacterium]|nr:hypothetical protein [Nocardioidaceae bacterium]